MNILNVFGLFVILLKCVAASGNTWGAAFKEAVGREGFEWLRENYWSWIFREDLLDDVITKGVDFTVRFIQNVEDAKGRVLAALFEKETRG